MSKFCGAHRIPRAGVDPIDRRRAALAVIRLAMHDPPTDETIALVLDDDRRGRTIVVVDGTDEPDSVLDVVERLADSIADSGAGGASSSPRCGRAAARSTATTTAGWRPATSPTTPASSCSSGSSRRAPARHGVVPARPARRAAAVVTRSAGAAPAAGPGSAAGRRPRRRRTSSRLPTSTAPRRPWPDDAPRGCRSGRPGSRGGGCRPTQRSRAARRATCRSPGGTTGGRGTTTAGRRSARPPPQSGRSPSPS